MKKNGLLFLAIAAIGAGIYFSVRGNPFTGGKVRTTGTATAPPQNFWEQLLASGGRLAGQGANRAVYGSSSGGGGGKDFTPLAKGAVEAGGGLLVALGQWFKKKLFSGSSQPASSAPGTSDGYGDDPFKELFDGYSLTSEPEYSEGGGFNGPAWIPSGSPYLYQADEGVSPEGNSTFDSYNDAVSGSSIDESYDSAVQKWNA